MGHLDLRVLGTQTKGPPDQALVDQLVQDPANFVMVLAGREQLVLGDPLVGDLQASAGTDHAEEDPPGRLLLLGNQLLEHIIGDSR